MNKKIYSILFFFFALTLQAQEGIPVYHDYLSDNLFLLHPSMAGASYCAKARMTARTQWFGIEDAPNFQTLSFNTYLGNFGKVGLGGIIFNDKNGYHSQKGIQLAFAYHLDFGNGADLNKLSFGISTLFAQNQLDETSFDPTNYDPLIAGILLSENYFNVDFGFSYHVQQFSLNFTIKNALLMNRSLYSGYESQNLRNYIGSASYYFGRGDLHLEPSFLIQYKEHQQQLIIDHNIKAYYDLSRVNQAYFGLSYRRDYSKDPYALSNITPIIGVRLNQFTLGYTYTYDLEERVYSNSGFHQITLGYNFNCRRPVSRIKCPQLD
jgi:type IX secretion system PorP/SprF family membrane protein